MFHFEIQQFELLIDFREPYWCTKMAHQYGVSMQSSTKVRQMFQQITQKMGPQRCETWTNCLYISLL